MSCSRMFNKDKLHRDLYRGSDDYSPMTLMYPTRVSIQYVCTVSRHSFYVKVTGINYKPSFLYVFAGHILSSCPHKRTSLIAKSTQKVAIKLLSSPNTNIACSDFIGKDSGQLIIIKFTVYFRFIEDIPIYN